MEKVNIPGLVGLSVDDSLEVMNEDELNNVLCTFLTINIMI